MAGRSKQGNDQDLIRRLRQGEEDAFNEIFRECYTSLVLNAYRITDNQAAAEDIAEETFMKLWERRVSLPEIGSLKSYLYMMSHNASLSWLRKTKSELVRDKKSILKEEAFDPTVLENMIYTEMMSGIYAVMEKLPTQCRKVFILHYIEGKKIADIAKELKISIGTVNTHKFRGIHLLQKALLGCFFWMIALAV